MDVSPELQGVAASLAASAVRNTAQAIADKVSALKAKGKAEETINGLEEVINALIQDKIELTRIAQAYEAELVAQRLTPGDIDYITANVIPILQKVMEASGSGSGQSDQMIQGLKTLLSPETVNILQILGFNFRDAIGEPATTLARQAILARASSGPTSDEVKALELRREVALYDIALDEDATARLKELLGR